MTFELDYDQMLFLDAEELAEGGIAAAYELLLPRLRQYVMQPGPIEEQLDTDTGRYAIGFAGQQYIIYDRETGAGEPDSWGRATHALFAIINHQLAATPYRFFAINGGNDLGGLFLTPAEAEGAKHGLHRRTDWPYLPTDLPPWFGQFH